MSVADQSDRCVRNFQNTEKRTASRQFAFRSGAYEDAAAAALVVVWMSVYSVCTSCPMV